MSSGAGFYGLVDDVARIGGRFIGRGDGSKYEGKFGSDQFFTDVTTGNKAALELLKDKNYGATWKISALRRSAEDEIRRGLGRTGLQKPKPRGLLTGYAHYGIGRASNVIFNKTSWMWAAALGIPMTAMAVGSAPRGKAVSTAAKGMLETVGGMVGAGIGASLLGLPGELIGGFAGAELGKVASVLDYATNARAQGRYLNFGAGYKDTEQAYTMRQRAVQEMGRSVLNARQYLGKEAALFHQ
jgi:hypothetical protein